MRSLKKGFLNISQNSRKNTFVGVSFLIKLHFEELSFAIFLRTYFFTEHFRWLFLNEFRLFPQNGYRNTLRLI